MRQPCFLAQDNWKTVPWALNPASKNQQNLLTDILVDIPTLLETYDAQYKESGEKQQFGNGCDLLSRIDATLFSLCCWRYTWELLNPNAAYETTPPPTDGGTRLVPNRLYFHTYKDAANIQLYNAILIFLIDLLDRLSPPTAKMDSILQRSALHAAKVSSYHLTLSPTNTAPLCLPHTVLSSFEPAIEIIRAFEFQIHKAAQNVSSNLFFLFPLGIAGEVLKKKEEYRSWIQTLLNTSRFTKGYAAGRNNWFGDNYKGELQIRSRNNSKEIIPVRHTEWKTERDFRYRRAAFLAGVSSTS